MFYSQFAHLFAANSNLQPSLLYTLRSSCPTQNPKDNKRFYLLPQIDFSLRKHRTKEIKADRRAQGQKSAYTVAYFLCIAGI